ncbi:MAG: SDR family NAD(P)-dependent oxidoreductase [Gammaproteobacteria bacterium]
MKGSAAVVTGGGSGIGRGIAIALADAGADVMVADIDAGAAQSTAAAVAARGVRSDSMRVDVVDPENVEALAQAAFEHFAGLRILINSAGVAVRRPLLEATQRDWDYVMAVSLYGIVNCCRSFATRWKAAGTRAQIVNNASMAALLAQPIEGLGIYNAVKHACLGYSESLRNELAPHGIDVGVLCPGFVVTDLQNNSLRHRQERFGGPEQASYEAPSPPAGTAAMTAGRCGEIVVRALAQRRLLILTHPERRWQVQARHAAFMEDFDAAEGYVGAD